jgi:hypothetical protein
MEASTEKANKSLQAVNIYKIEIAISYLKNDQDVGLVYSVLQN